jgi:hypothetical protein
MILMSNSGKVIKEHECAEILTGYLKNHGTPGQDVYVKVHFTNERLNRANEILEKHGFPKLEVSDSEELKKITTARLFGTWIKVIAPQSTPVFHASLRAIRDGSEYKFTLLELAAEIEEKYGCHWVAITGVEYFLLYYVHPKLYAERLLPHVSYLETTNIKSFMALQLGYGPQVKQTIMREKGLSVLEVRNFAVKSNNWYEYSSYTYAYIGSGTYVIQYPLMAHNAPHFGNVYFLHDDPAVLDTKNWLIK